jgi:DNA polymerase-3 subunit epsilon
MSWHTEPMTAWDTETTSADPEQARIVTSTVVRIHGNQVEPKEWLLDPGVEIPEAATAIHGVSTERARKEGMPAGAAVKQIATEICEAWFRNEPVVVFNAHYDFTVLDREMRRHHGHGITIAGTVIDPLTIDKELDRYRKGSRTLSAQCAHYRVRLEDAHSSIGDALAAARLAWRLAIVFPEYLSRLEDLDELQARWHARQAAHLEEYFAKQGRPEPVAREWPLIPFEAAS